MSDIRDLMSKAVQTANGRWEKALGLPTPEVALYRSLSATELDRIAQTHGLADTLRYIQTMEHQAQAGRQ